MKFKLTESIYDDLNKIDNEESLGQEKDVNLNKKTTLDSKHFVRKFIKELGWPQECVDRYVNVDGIGGVDVFKGKGPYYNIRLYNVKCYSDKAAEISNQADQFLKRNGIKFPMTTTWAGRGHVALIMIPAYPNKFERT